MAKPNRPAAMIPGGRPMRWPTIERLCARAQAFVEEHDRELPGLRSMDPRPEMLQTAIASGLIEDVFFLYENGSREHPAGFFFCPAGIIAKRSRNYGADGFTSWLAFVTGRLLPLEAPGTCRIHDSGGTVRILAFCGEQDAPRIHQALEALQNELRIHCGGAEIMDEPVPAELPAGAAAENLARCAREFIIGYDQTILRDIRRGDLQAMRSLLGIPAGTEIFLYHDDTERKIGTAGFAITSSGFYCRAKVLEDSGSFTDWRTFYTSALETGPYLLRRTPGVPLAECTVGRSASEAFLFISHLHAYLRGRFGT